MAFPDLNMAKTGNVTKPYSDINTFALYMLSLAAILYLSYQAPDKFLFMEVKTLPVSLLVVQFAIILSGVLMAFQIVNWIKQYNTGTLSLPYLAYMISHHSVFIAGYFLLQYANDGWLLFNIWHSAQYIAFVWWKNNAIYQGKIDQSNKLLSTISQNNKFPLYMGVCLFVTFAFYAVMKIIIAVLSLDANELNVTLFLFMTINFHHYIVDSVIWKRR